VEPQRIQEFDWWQGASHGGVQVTATPAQHFSGRGLWDRDSTLWAGWVLQAGGQRIFYSGDTGYFGGFRQIGERLGPIDLALMENGAYDAYWPAVHMQPEETVQAFQDLGARLLYLVHNSTFNLAFHTWQDPLERVAALAQANGPGAGHARDRRGADHRPAAHQPAVVGGPEVRPAKQRRTWLVMAALLCGLPALGADRDINAALRAAAERNDAPAFQGLLTRNADVNARDEQQDTAFLIAARNGHTALVQSALAAGADLKSLNRYGSTALMGPSYRGHVETVRVLLGTSIDVHHVNNLGWTALLEAIVLGTDGPAHREIVRLLIARGSDVNARDREGTSALQLAQRKGQTEVVRLLRAAGAR
jgi:hypothetical protein